MTEFVFHNSQQLNHFLKAQESELPFSHRAWFQLRMSRILFAARQLFSGHVVGSRPMKWKEKYIE